MRSRDMMVKLDRLPTEEDEVKVWDLSLLSPKDQDRANELMKLMEGIENIEDESLNPIIAEFSKLVEGLPMLGEDDPEQGPLIEVPKSLAHCWQWRQPATGWRSYNFYNLSKVQTLRFVELCTQYGYEEGRNANSHMTPLSQWQADDQAEMREMIEIVAAGYLAQKQHI
jgi:hypothetical protein